MTIITETSLLNEPLRRNRFAPQILLCLGLVLGTLTMGCDSNCRQACKKLINECETAQEGYGQDQCELECETFQSFLEQDPAQEAESIAFQENLNCVVSTECSALTDPADPEYPACYDPEAYPF